MFYYTILNSWKQTLMYYSNYRVLQTFPTVPSGEKKNSHIVDCNLSLLSEINLEYTYHTLFSFL